MKKDLRICPIKGSNVYAWVCEKKCHGVKCEFAKTKNVKTDRQATRKAAARSLQKGERSM